METRLKNAEQIAQAHHQTGAGEDARHHQSGQEKRQLKFLPQETNQGDGKDETENGDPGAGLGKEPKKNNEAGQEAKPLTAFEFEGQQGS